MPTPALSVTQATTLLLSPPVLPAQLTTVPPASPTAPAPSVPLDTMELIAVASVRLTVTSATLMPATSALRDTQ